MSLPELFSFIEDNTMSGKYPASLGAFLAVFLHFVPLQIPTVIAVVDKANSRFFWYPTDNRTYVPAFLDGGPHPKAIEGDIRFHLYTLQNKDKSQELFVDKTDDLEGSFYIPDAPLKIITHGFGSNAYSGPGPTLKESYFRNERDYNVIVIDWSTLAAAPWYDTAAAATKIVGKHAADLVMFLVSQNATRLKDVHFVGHSLGAHVGGFMGSYIGAGLVGRITGLDPALPLFGTANDTGRLDPTDGAFVDVIHTSAGSLLEGGLAFKEPRGHVDFYPNGGSNQPGCGPDAFGACSHRRGYEYMAESIDNTERFQSCRCNSWEDFTTGFCGCAEAANMGEYVSYGARGKFYLHTRTSSPWSESAERA